MQQRKEMLRMSKCFRSNLLRACTTCKYINNMHVAVVNDFSTDVLHVFRAQATVQATL